jgi:hypothetical protein
VPKVKKEKNVRKESKKDKVQKEGMYEKCVGEFGRQSSFIVLNKDYLREESIEKSIESDETKKKS